MLYTRIGIIMEDASVVALKLGSPDGAAHPTKVAQLQTAVSTIIALAEAAAALVSVLEQQAPPAAPGT